MRCVPLRGTTPSIAGASVDRSADLPVVAVVLSYDNAYPWQEQIVEGLMTELEGRAVVHMHEMDTLGVAGAEALEGIGNQARAWVRGKEPDAVIVADDNAMRVGALPSAEEGRMPGVFCGVNWPASAYGLPRDGLHGMVEVSPADRLFDLLGEGLSPGDRVVILGADRPTDRAQAEGFIQTARASGLEARAELVRTFDEWADAFARAQEGVSLLYLLNNAGIRGWSDSRALDLVTRETRTLTATEYVWMRPFAVVSVTKRGQEQGRWSALHALHLIERPEFPMSPIVVNRDVSVSVNEELLSVSGRELPPVFDALRGGLR